MYVRERRGTDELSGFLFPTGPIDREKDPLTLLEDPFTLDLKNPQNELTSIHNLVSPPDEDLTVDESYVKTVFKADPIGAIMSLITKHSQENRGLEKKVLPVEPEPAQEASRSRGFLGRFGRRHA